jgi:DNA-binding MarR family transcriptional regulator
MLEHDFQSEVGYWVHMAAHRFECAMNIQLATEGITYRQCQVLAWLAIKGKLSQVDLADCLRVDPSTLVKVLDRMERDGLITRAACPEDRRRKYIAPTKKAVPVWRRIIDCAGRVRERSIRGLSPAEVKTLRRMLEHVYENLADDAAADRLSVRN